MVKTGGWIAEMSETSANKTAFAAQLDVKPCSKATEFSSSTDRSARLSMPVLSMVAVFFCGLVVLVLGGVALRGQSSSISLKRASTSNRNLELLSGRPSASLKPSFRALTSRSASKTVNTAGIGNTPCSCSGILATIKQRPKVTAAIIAIIVIVIIGTVVASVFLLSPSPHVDGMDETSGSTKPDHGNKPPLPPPTGLSTSAIAGIAVGAIALVLVAVGVVVFARLRAWSGSEQVLVVGELTGIDEVKELRAADPTDERGLDVRWGRIVWKFTNKVPSDEQWSDPGEMRRLSYCARAWIANDDNADKFTAQDLSIKLYRWEHGNIMSEEKFASIHDLFKSIGSSRCILTDYETHAIPKKIVDGRSYNVIPENEVFGRSSIGPESLKFWQRVYNSFIYMINDTLKPELCRLKIIGYVAK